MRFSNLLKWCHDSSTSCRSSTCEMQDELAATVVVKKSTGCGMGHTRETTIAIQFAFEGITNRANSERIKNTHKVAIHTALDKCIFNHDSKKWVELLEDRTNILNNKRAPWLVVDSFGHGLL